VVTLTENYKYTSTVDQYMQQPIILLS